LLVQKRRDIVAFEAFNFALLAILRLLTSYLLLLLLAGLLRPRLGRTDRRKKESFGFRDYDAGRLFLNSEGAFGTSS
jgi:hypothetical protein